MNHKKHLKSVAVSIAFMALAGCGGGSSSSQSQTVNGVVADGYLKGAIVCIDTNANKKCDAGEPSGVTVAGGNYSIPDVSSSDLATHHIVVEVPTGAEDSDRGTVTSPYVMTAPAGKPEFISPLTTLVQNQMETSGLSVAEAEATVKNQLGLNTLSPLSNFMAASTAEEKVAAGIAKVVATTIADNKNAIETAAGSSNVTVNQVVNLIVQQVMANLSTVVQQVNTATNNGATTLANTEVANVVTASNVAVSTVDVTALKQQLTAAGATTVAPSVSELAAILVSGMYSVDQWWNGLANVFEYEKVTFTAPGTLTFPSYILGDGAWVARTEKDNDLYLTSTGWKLENGSTSASFDPATGVYTSPGGFEQMNVRATSIDLTNQLVFPYLKRSFQAPDLIDQLATFPSGAIAYRLTFVPAAEIYRLSSNWSICKQYDNATNSCTSNFASLTEMLSSLSPGSGRWTGSDGNYNIQFEAIDPATMTGVLRIGNGNFSPSQQSVAISKYKLVTVHGEQLIVADLTPVNSGYTIFAMYNGSVRGGEFRPAKVAQLSNNFNFNKTAIDAIMKAARLPVVVGKMAAR